MATYVVTNRYNITRHEGNRADWVVVVPDVLSMTGLSVSFIVRDADTGDVIMYKTTDDDITVDGQTITVDIAPADTTDHAGVHPYELDILNESDEPILSVNGNFIIKEQVAPYE